MGKSSRNQYLCDVFASLGYSLLVLGGFVFVFFMAALYHGWRP